MPMRISHSAKEVFQECSYKYFLKYFLKLRPTGYKSPLAFGSAIDEGLNTLLETRDIELAIIKFETSWEFFRDKDVSYSKSDLDDWLSPPIEDMQMRTWISLKHRGCFMLREYNKQVMPLIKEVLKVQIDQTVANEKGDELVIKTDFIAVMHDGRRVLFDNKTSSMAYAEDSVRTSQQLSIYYETLKSEYNLTHAGYIVIPKRLRKKKLPAIDISIIIDEIPQATIDATLESYDTALTSIKSGQFKCNMESCMKPWGKCEYYDYCRSGSMEGLEEKK